MADEAQLKILKEQGVKAWNEWRTMNPGIRPDLTGADLRRANLNKANLRQADLSWARFFGSDLIAADLREVTLWGASLQSSNLGRANLRRADLRMRRLRALYLKGADLTEAMMMDTIFARVNLSGVLGLEEVEHYAASTIGIDTIYLSGGNIPEIFLRGAGVPEPFIANIKSLVAAMSPIEFFSCFISYSSKDQEFAERLYADLQTNRVRCWFAPEDLRIGDRLRSSFDEAIRLHDKLLVILSESSVKSSWVEKEVETAFEKERHEERAVLFPIRLDDAVMETGEAWAADIRRTRHIGDFRGWKNHDSYKKAFDRLLRDLKAEGERAARA